MDARIILAGQPVNVLGAMAQGQSLAANQAQMQRTGEEWNLYRTHGAGIAEGDTNALRALAGFDPMAALNARGAHQEMAHADERMQLARAAAARAAQTHAAGLTAAQRAEEAQRLARVAAGLAPVIQRYADHPDGVAYIQDAFARAGFEETPANVDDAVTILAGIEGALPILQAREEMRGALFGAEAAAEPDYVTIDGRLVDRNAPGGPAVVPVAGMPEEAGFRMATPEELERIGLPAAQIGPDGRIYPINPPTGMRFTTGPDGTVTLVQGPGAGGAGDDAAMPARPALDGPGAAVEDIGRALAIVRENPSLATGFVGNLFRGVAGTRAFDLGQLTQTIGANITFETLNQMRQASSTGASGLGQVTQTEIGLLMATLGSIEIGQSAEQLEANLVRLEEAFNTVVHGHPQGEAAARAVLERGLPLYGQVVDGYQYMGGDPSRRESWRPAR